VIDFLGKPAPDRAGWTRINFLKYKLTDNVLYVNSSLTRPIVKQKRRKLKEKDWLDWPEADKGDVLSF
jgi:hypothetical protein